MVEVRSGQISMTPSPASPPIGRLNSLVLAAIVTLCLLMIGVAGFLKYQLDRAQTQLATPSLTSGDQDLADRLRRNLGYSGFLGSAQIFIGSRDPAALADMKTQLQFAKDAIEHLPEKTATETRRDLQAIIAAFENVLNKAEHATNDPATALTVTDLLPLYTALPLIDARIDSAVSSNRLAAQANTQFWSMLLTMVAWASLIIAAAMAVNVYLSIRDRNSAPLRALAQSVKNMAHGDMRTSIWGMERQDMIGELARAVDMARYHFSELPDVTVISDDGPLRMRFEGKTKSLFDALLQVIGKDSEKLRDQASLLTEVITRQHDALTAITSRVESVLQGAEKRGLDGDQMVKRLVQNIGSSAESLIHAQQHAAEQLNRLMPFMQERANGLAEIAQLTGKQVSQALQNLTLSERGLRASAEQSDVAIKKLSGTADELGNRLFGAVNLLQASGKVLAETTEQTQSRLNEVISKLMVPAGFELPAPAARPDDIETVVPHFDSEKFDKILAALEDTQMRLDRHVAEQRDAAKMQIDLLSSQSSGLLAQTGTAAQTLSTAADHLRDERAKFEQALSVSIAKLQNLNSETQGGQRNNEQQVLMQNAVLTSIRADIGSLRDKLFDIDGSLRNSSSASATAPALMELTAHITDGFKHNMTAFSTLRADIDALDRALRSAASSSSSAAHLTGLTDKVADGFAATTAQLGDLRKELGRLDQAVRDAAKPAAPLLTLTGQVAQGFDSANSQFDAIRQELKRIDGAVQSALQPQALPLNLPPEWRAEFTGGYEKIAHIVDGLRREFGQLTSMAELMKSAPELTRNIQDRWFQLAGQIEATRSDLSQIVVQQADRIERHLTGSALATGVSEPNAALQDTQRQMEQQTQILTELVTTLSVLDEHMQQLKSDLREVRG